MVIEFVDKSFSSLTCCDIYVFLISVDEFASGIQMIAIFHYDLLSFLK